MSHPQDSRWLSLVTVVRNDSPGLTRTAESLVGVLANDVEWLVVDGSDDPSEVPKLLAQYPLEARLVREEPRGIFPAMNVGLKVAGGEYIYYLNAGDEWHAGTSLDDVRSQIRHASDPVWVVGRVNFVDTDGRSVTPPLIDYEKERAHFFARGVFPPHQGTIASVTSLRAVGGFDTSLSIAADYATTLRLGRLCAPLELDLVLADFHLGGASTVEWRQSVGEFHRARRRELNLSGIEDVREYLYTSVHFGKLAINHWCLAPLREYSRRLFGGR